MCWRCCFLRIRHGVCLSWLPEEVASLYAMHELLSMPSGWCAGCSASVAASQQVSSAMAAVARLHGLSLEVEAGAGSCQSDTLEHGISSTVTRGQQLWARQVGGEGGHTKACRVIVRNLPFQVRRAFKTFAMALLRRKFSSFMSARSIQRLQYGPHSFLLGLCGR